MIPHSDATPRQTPAPQQQSESGGVKAVQPQAPGPAAGIAADRFAPKLAAPAAAMPSLAGLRGALAGKLREFAAALQKVMAIENMLKGAGISVQEAEGKPENVPAKFTPLVSGYKRSKARADELSRICRALAEELARAAAAQRENEDKENKDRENREKQNKPPRAVPQKNPMQWQNPAPQKTPAEQPKPMQRHNPAHRQNLAPQLLSSARERAA